MTMVINTEVVLNLSKVCVIFVLLFIFDGYSTIISLEYRDREIDRGSLIVLVYIQRAELMLWMQSFLRLYYCFSIVLEVKRT